jgi:hypothetical protein
MTAEWAGIFSLEIKQPCQRVYAAWTGPAKEQCGHKSTSTIPELVRCTIIDKNERQR